MKKTIPWLETEDYAPDALSDDTADSMPECEEESLFWDNMIFPV